MCKNLHCEVCNKQITKIPKYCSRKCKGKDISVVRVRYFTVTLTGNEPLFTVAIRDSSGLL